MTMTVERIPVDIADDAYNVRDGNARLTFMLGQDFPGERSKKTRGEIWYIEVPESQRKKGVGLIMCQRALTEMKKKGMKTVVISPVSKEGRMLVISLVHNGDVSQPIKQSASGKMEFKIL